MTYLQNETGAVTVDWVVLTAALVGLGLATMAVVSAGVQDTSGDIEAQLEADGIIVSSFATPQPSFPVDQGRYDEMYGMLEDMPANHFVSNDMYDTMMDAVTSAAADGDAEAYAAAGDRLHSVWDYWNDEVGGPMDGEPDPDTFLAANPL